MGRDKGTGKDGGVMNEKSPPFPRLFLPFHSSILISSLSQVTARRMRGRKERALSPFSLWVLPALANSCKPTMQGRGEIGGREWPFPLFTKCLSDLEGNGEREACPPPLFVRECP